jgi:hypothetical protein
MKITIEFDTETADFEDDRQMAVTRIMQQAQSKVMDCLYINYNGPIRVPVKDANGNRVGILEINL